MILFTVSTTSNQQNHLKESFSNNTFQFCENMDEAKDYLSKAEILVTYGEDLTRILIDEATNLKWIMVLSAGMERLPFDIVQERGILVTNARGIHKVPMSEYVISMLLQVYRQEKLLIQNEEKKIWDKQVEMREISGRKMLIVGTGAIGQEVARLAKAFQMTTYGVSRGGKQVNYIDKAYKVDDLDHVLPKVDFVVTVLPSTGETRGLFTKKQFELMQNHAIFLNMGRGDLVSSDDLLDSISKGQIAHAILDVFEKEPLRTDHPFWKEDNITITSHISGVSLEYLPRALDIFSYNLEVYMANQDNYKNKVNVNRGY